MNISKFYNKHRPALIVGIVLSIIVIIGTIYMAFFREKTPVKTPAPANTKNQTIVTQKVEKDYQEHPIEVEEEVFIDAEEELEQKTTPGPIEEPKKAEETPKAESEQKTTPKTKEEPKKAEEKPGEKTIPKPKEEPKKAKEKLIEKTPKTEQKEKSVSKDIPKRTEEKPDKETPRVKPGQKTTPVQKEKPKRTEEKPTEETPKTEQKEKTVQKTTEEKKTVQETATSQPPKGIVSYATDGLRSFFGYKVTKDPNRKLPVISKNEHNDIMSGKLSLNTLNSLLKETKVVYKNNRFDNESTISSSMRAYMCHKFIKGIEKMITSIDQKTDEEKGDYSDGLFYAKECVIAIKLANVVLSSPNDITKAIVTPEEYNFIFLQDKNFIGKCVANALGLYGSENRSIYIVSGDNLRLLKISDE